MNTTRPPLAVLQTYRARRVLAPDRSGSSWPVAIETDAGVFVTKLRGAAQAPASLVAEVIVGALADALGLSVPTRVLIDIRPGVPVDDPQYELRRLLQSSTGLNLGFQLLAGSRRFHPSEAERVEPDLASTIVWLDGLVQNPDRTMKNPNLLWSNEQLFLIDHGAALPFHHNWRTVTEASPRTNTRRFGEHVLQSRATHLRALDDSLAAQLTRHTLEAAVEAIPDDFLPAGSVEIKQRRRAAYVAFLWKRLRGPRPFVEADVAS